LALLNVIVAWALRHRAVVLVLTLLLVVVGLRSATTLPIDAVPDVTNVQVQIITTAPALSPVEIEQYITVPIERAMGGIPHATQVRSISKPGISVVTVVFTDDTPIYFARQQVNERMRDAQETVQHGKPDMGPISSGLGEVFQFVVRNPQMNAMQLQEVLRWQISPALRIVPGIVEVNAFGGEERQYQVVLDPKQLQASGISVAQVVQALEQSNGNAGGGYLEHDREQVVIGTDGLVKSLDDLRRVVIGATPQGTPITIATVGDARFGPRLRLGAASKDAQGEVVIGVAMMLLGENSRTVTEAVKAKLTAIAPSLPEGTVIEPFYDRSVLVNRTMTTVARNLAEGALLVIAVLLLLLGDVRAGVIVAVTIPLSLLFAVTAMNAFGLSGNLMSLGAIDFGLIVDGAVIIVENVVRQFDHRQPALGRELTPEERVDTVREATVEVRAASVYGELIIAIVYVPILALTAIEGKLFRPMATTVLLALAGAFLVSLTTVPVLASYFVKRRTDAVHEETFVVRKVHAAFVPILGAAMRARWVTMGAAVLAFAGAIALFTRIGAEFVPQLDEGDLLVEARRIPGVALSESIEMDRRMQKAVLEIPEIVHAVGRTGAPQIANDPMGVEQTDLYLQLKKREDWRPGIDRDALARAITDKLGDLVPEVGTAISQPIQMRTNELIAGIRSDVAVLLYGSDLDLLATSGAAIADVIRTVPGAVDVRLEQVAGLRYLRIVPDRARLARYGLTIGDVNVVTETMSVGHPVGEILEGDRRFSMVIKTGHDFTGDLEPLRALPLRSVSGQIVPLGDVATLKYATGPAQVSRENLSRRISVEFNVRGRDLLSVVRDVEGRIAREVRLPPGYRIEVGGQFEHYLDARARLAIVVPLALAMIFFLLYMATDSVRSALVIFLGVPFAIVGGVVALTARGLPFSISAGIGFIALFGVAVLNGLVLVSFARHLEAGGMDANEAIRRAAELRLRPVLTTALVAALGFIPMALSTAPGSEVQRPLATVVIGGLVSATLLTLLVLPVVDVITRRRPSARST